MMPRAFAASAALFWRSSSVEWFRQTHTFNAYMALEADFVFFFWLIGPTPMTPQSSPDIDA